MIRIRGTNEFIVGSVQAVAYRLDFSRYTIHEFLRTDACFRSL